MTPAPAAAGPEKENAVAPEFSRSAGVFTPLGPAIGWLVERPNAPAVSPLPPAGATFRFRLLRLLSTPLPLSPRRSGPCSACAASLS